MFPFNQGRIRPRKTGLNRDYLRCALSTDWNQTLLHSFMLKLDCSSQQSKQSLVTWQLEANFANMEVAQQPGNQKYPINQPQSHHSIFVHGMECLELWLMREAKSMWTDRSLLLIPLHLSFHTVEKLSAFFPAWHHHESLGFWLWVRRYDGHKDWINIFAPTPIMWICGHDVLPSLEATEIFPRCWGTLWCVKVVSNSDDLSLKAKLTFWSPTLSDSIYIVQQLKWFLLRI